MKKHFLLIISLLAIAGIATAKPQWRQRKSKQNDTLIVKAFTDSLMSYKAKLDTTRLSSDGTANADSRFFHLFTPTTFYRSVAGDMLGNDGMEDNDTEPIVNSTLMNIYLNRPFLVRQSEKTLNKYGNVHKEISAPIKRKERLEDRMEERTMNEQLDMPLDIIAKKPNFWKVSGDYYLQVLQNYVSSNWYKGGESNYSMVASLTMQANYNNKQKVKFDNKLEMKLGFQTSKGDTLHSVKTSEDLLRYTGKLGLQASKKWYYSLQLIAYTQFMRGYKSNDTFVYSDILSPLNVNVSVGMDYNVSWFRDKLKGTIQMAPLAYNFKYVGRKSLATRYGLDEGKHTLNDFGSECTVDLTWTITDMIKWKTRLYGYTTYKRAELEWENTLSLQFNKYITSNIFVYPRFDDGAKRDKDHGYWQLKEYASIGFALSF